MKKEISPELQKRLPPGQYLTENFPVLQHGTIIHLDREKYNLEIAGEVDSPRNFTLIELEQMMDRDELLDIHCVTTWSKFDTRWAGVSFQKLINIVKPKSSVKFVEFKCADSGFTTTIPMDAIKHPGSMLALKYEGNSLDDNHGGPVRGLIPHLFFYKSAKWVVKISFLNEDRLGYWEQGGYSNKADPWKNQRYRRDDNK